MMGERRVTADGRILERMPDGSIVEVGRQDAQAPAMGGMILPEPPPAPPQAPGRTAAGATTEGLKPGFMWIDPNNPAAGQTKIPVNPNPAAPDVKERGAQIKQALAAIQQARTQAAESMAVGSASQFFQGTPFLNQNRLNIESTLRNAEAGIIQDMVRSLAEVNQGGVSGMANSSPEAQRMGAAIADLNPNQDMASLLVQLDRAEEYYLRQAAQVEGKPVEEISKQYLPKERQVEMAARQPEEMALTSDGTKAVPIPQWYQDAVNRYVAENGKNLDPSQYAAFRLGLDESAGIPGNFNYYVEDGTRLRDGVAAGGKLTPIPSTRSVKASPLEQAVTSFAQTPLGAAVATFSNSTTAGLPAYLTGGTEKLEAVRQNQPVAGFLGDVAGGIAGTMALGGGLGALGARGIIANPMAQNAAFSAVSGATQSEDPMQGALIGAVGSLGGDLLGRSVGRALPSLFAPRAMNEAIESVPTGGELGNQADRLYRAAAANGEQIAPPQTDQFIDNAEKFLRESGYMTQQGDILGTGPVQDAARLLQSFRGRAIGPQEAQTIRNKLAEGRMAMRDGAPDFQARMFSGNLTKQFDEFAEAQNALPGIASAREVAQRRIMGRELDRAREMGQARGDINYSQGSEDLGIRRAFGALDTGEIRGGKMYPEAVQEAIRTVSRGTPARNMAQWMGRFSPQGGGGLFGGAGIGGLVGTTAGDVATGGMTTGALYGAGLFGRSLANRMTRRDAEMASLIARGGPQFQGILQQVMDEAALRGGRVGAGMLGSVAVSPLRD